MHGSMNVKCVILHRRADFQTFHMPQRHGLNPILGQPSQEGI